MEVKGCIRHKFCKNLPKCCFLFLAVFVFISILGYLDLLKLKYEEISTINLQGATTDPQKHHGFCTFQPLSSTDALEERLILDSIAWPETPLLPAPLPLNQTSDPAHSTFTILPGKREGGQWHVGDQLEVMIQIYDFQGQAKKSGGDVLIARLHNKTLGAGQPEVKESIGKSGVSGYYYQGVWRALGGIKVRQFNSPSAVNQCLKGKIVHLYGDSTIRQWFEYLNAFLPDVKEFNLYSFKQVGPFMMLDNANKFLVTYRCHGPPISFRNVPISELRYIANEIDGVTGGDNTVIVFTVGAHFNSFPIELYIRRLQSIRRAVVHLLDRAPGTLVVIRTPNLRALTLKMALTNSDWFSLQQDKVLRAIFKGLNVCLVDALEMTLAHHMPHNIHPPRPIIKNMIDVLLSYVCPQKGS
uniref:NXPE family member 3-like n=1 Tax=Semicossyphus pulcher TaxID=241346 RepID=UPI0037E7255C